MSAAEFKFVKLDTGRWWRGVLRAELTGPAGNAGLDVGLVLVNQETREPIEMDYSSQTVTLASGADRFDVELSGVRVGQVKVDAYVIASNTVIAGPLNVG
jgi:hypothetical protein